MEEFEKFQQKYQNADIPVLLKKLCDTYDRLASVEFCIGVTHSMIALENYEKDVKAHYERIKWLRQLIFDKYLDAKAPSEENCKELT